MSFNEEQRMSVISAVWGLSWESVGLGKTCGSYQIISWTWATDTLVEMLIQTCKYEYQCLSVKMRASVLEWYSIHNNSVSSSISGTIEKLASVRRRELRSFGEPRNMLILKDSRSAVWLAYWGLKGWFHWSVSTYLESRNMIIEGSSV